MLLRKNICQIRVSVQLIAFKVWKCNAVLRFLRILSTHNCMEEIQQVKIQLLPDLNTILI